MSSQNIATAVFPRQHVARVETALSPSLPSPLPAHLYPLEASAHLDEVSHQRRLALLPEGGTANPDVCPNAYYGLRRADGVVGGGADTMGVGGAGGVGLGGVDGPAEAAPLLGSIFESYLLGGGSAEDGEEPTADSSAATGVPSLRSEGVATRMHWKAAIPAMLRPAAMGAALNTLDVQPQPQGQGQAGSAAPSVNAPLDDAALCGTTGEASLSSHGAAAADEALRVHLEDCLVKRHFGVGLPPPSAGGGGVGGGNANSNKKGIVSVTPRVRDMQAAVALHYLTFVTPLLEADNNNSSSNNNANNTNASNDTADEGFGGEAFDDGLGLGLPSSAPAARPLAAGLIASPTYNVAAAVAHQLRAYGLSSQGEGGNCHASVEEISVAPSALSLVAPTFLPSSQSLPAAFGAADNALADGFVRAAYDTVHAHVMGELMRRATSASSVGVGVDAQQQTSTLKVFVITGLEALAGSAAASASPIPTPTATLNALASLLWALASLLRHLNTYRTAPLGAKSTNSCGPSSGSSSQTLSSSGVAFAPAPLTAAASSTVSLLDILYGDGHASANTPAAPLNADGGDNDGSATATPPTEWAIRIVVCLPPSLSAGLGERLASHAARRLRLPSLAVAVPLSELGAVAPFVPTSSEATITAVDNNNDASAVDALGLCGADAGEGTNGSDDTSNIVPLSHISASSAAALFVQREAYGVPVLLSDASTPNIDANKTQKEVTHNKGGALVALSAKWAAAAVQSAADRLVSLHNNYIADASTIGTEEEGATDGLGGDDDDDAIQYVNGSRGDDADAADGEDDAAAADADGTSDVSRYTRFFTRAPAARRQPVVVVVTPTDESRESLLTASSSSSSEEAAATSSSQLSITAAVRNMYTSVPVHITSAAALRARLEAAVAEEEERQRTIAAEAANANTNAVTTGVKPPTIAKLSKDALLAKLLAAPTSSSDEDDGDADNFGAGAAANGADDGLNDDSTLPADATAVLPPVTFVTVCQDELASLAADVAGDGFALTALFRSLFVFSGDVLHTALRASPSSSASSASSLASEGSAMAHFVAIRAAAAVFGAVTSDVKSSSVSAAAAGVLPLLPILPSLSAKAAAVGDIFASEEAAEAERTQCEAIAFPRSQMDQMSIEAPLSPMGLSAPDGSALSTVVSLVVRVLTPRWEISTAASTAAGAVTDARFRREGDSDEGADPLAFDDFGGASSDVVAAPSSPFASFSPSPLAPIARFLHDPMPLSYLESLFLYSSSSSSATSASNSALASSESAAKRQLAVLLLAFSRRLRSADADAAAVLRLSRAHKGRSREEAARRKAEVARARRLAQQGRTPTPAPEQTNQSAHQKAPLPTDASGAPLMDVCAPLAHDSTAAASLLFSDAMLDILLQENPLSLLSSSSSSSFSSSSSSAQGVAKGWVGDVIHFLAHSGLVLPLRVVQNTPRAAPRFVRALERQRRAVAGGFASLQEALRVHMRDRLATAAAANGGNKPNAAAVVAGVTNTAWAPNFASLCGAAPASALSTATFSPTSIVLSSAALVLTPLGRRVSALTLPSEPIVCGGPSVPTNEKAAAALLSAPAPTPIGLAHAKHLLTAHAYGLPIVTALRNTCALRVVSASSSPSLSPSPSSPPSIPLPFSLASMLGGATRRTSKDQLEAVAAAARALLFVPLTGAMVGESLLITSADDAEEANGAEEDAKKAAAEEGASVRADGIPLAQLAAAVAAWPDKAVLVKKKKSVATVAVVSSGSGVPFVASPFCNRCRVYDPTIIERAISAQQPTPNASKKGGPSSSAAAPPPSRDSIQLPSRGWLTNASPIVVPEGVRRLGLDDESDGSDGDGNSSLTPAERAARRQQRKDAAEAKAAAKKRLESASVTFSTLSKKALKKRRRELAKGGEGGGAADSGALSAAAAEMLRVPAKMTLIGLSLAIDPSREGGEYLVPASGTPYPSMSRELCVVGTTDPFSGLLSGSSTAAHHNSVGGASLLVRSAVVPIGAADALIVLRLALRNALANLCVTLEAPHVTRTVVVTTAGDDTNGQEGCADSAKTFTYVYVSPLLDVLDPLLRQPTSRLRHLTLRLQRCDAADAATGTTNSGRLFVSGLTAASAAVGSLLLLVQQQQRKGAAESISSSSSSPIGAFADAGRVIASCLDSSIRYTYRDRAAALLQKKKQKKATATEQQQQQQPPSGTDGPLGLISALCGSCFAVPRELTCVPPSSAFARCDYAAEYVAAISKAYGLDSASTANGALGSLSTFARLVAVLLRSPDVADAADGQKQATNAASIDHLGQWLDSIVGASAESSSAAANTATLLPTTTTNTFFGAMPSFSAHCAHAAFRSRASITDIVAARKQADLREADRRRQAAREAAARFGGEAPTALSSLPTAASAGGAPSSAAPAADVGGVVATEAERKIIANAVKTVKARGREAVERLFRGKPMFGFLDEGDRLHALYTSLLLLEGIE